MKREVPFLCEIRKQLGGIMDKVKGKQSGSIAVYDSYEDYKQGKPPKNVSRFGDNQEEDQDQENQENQENQKE